MKPLPATEDYLIPDLLAPGLKLVFCGTALGHESARQRAYYAHPQNKFWRTLHETGITPERIAPADYPRMLRYQIGLTDMNKTEHGMDHALDRAKADAEGLRAKLLHYAPQRLAFTSKNAASYFYGKPTGKLQYGEQAEFFGPTQIWILPSPSPAAQTSWDILHWQALAECLR